MNKLLGVFCIAFFVIAAFVIAVVAVQTYRVEVHSGRTNRYPISIDCRSTEEIRAAQSNPEQWNVYIELTWYGYKKVRNERCFE